MRAESFRPPVPRTIVDALIDDGWDVWMLNWRGSIDLDPRPWTFDDVARYDHPAAVRHLVEHTGATAIAAIAHCAGSATISMSAVAGLVPQVETIVSNGVSLTPVLPPFARFKLRSLLPVLHNREPYLDVAWRDGPERLVPWITRTAVRIWHAECNNPVCNMASFALGSGNPALWWHRNLDAPTHAWLLDEFGRIPLSFYAQVSRSDRAGRIVSMRSSPELPPRFAETAPKTTARFALFTGDGNRAFLPESQRRTHAYLERHQPARHSLNVLRGYRYTDVFIGRNAHKDVFPKMLAELNA